MYSSRALNCDQFFLTTCSAEEAFNSRFSQSMVLGKRNGTSGGVKLERSQNIKLLGIDIGSDLNFTNHVSDFCKRTIQQIGVLTR